MAINPATPFWQDFGKLQTDGQAASDAIGSVATTYRAAGLQVLGPRQQGWTPCTGGASGKNLAGLNGTAVVATFLTDSAANLTTGVLALATYVYEARKTIAALQEAIETHGAIGTTIA